MKEMKEQRLLQLPTPPQMSQRRNTLNQIFLEKNNASYRFSSVQVLSRVQLFATPWAVACQASLSITSPWRWSDSCPLSQWCHPTISSSVVPLFSSCLQFFPASESFPVTQSFTSCGQSVGGSVSAQSFQWISRTDSL